ncbi:hypothetical protein E2C01_063339 [Portunus trituberculatus]|uniref:Uncharacterized protein n=1 Tax=Portunus trituberculatus TaxID=210409 RepID=A0A5B7HKK2_PORTR|nr:hypothetical protein [Portunus trituberculatus]
MEIHDTMNCYIELISLWKESKKEHTLKTTRAPLNPPVQNNNRVSSSSSSLTQLTTKTHCNVG